MDGQTDGWTDEGVAVWMDGRMKGWMGGRTDEGVDGWMDR